MRRYFSNLNFTLGFSLSIVILIMAVVSLVWTPYNPNAMNPRHRLEGPGLQHPLGTDQYGRDVLSRVTSSANGDIDYVHLGSFGYQCHVGHRYFLYPRLFAVDTGSCHVALGTGVYCCCQSQWFE